MQNILQTAKTIILALLLAVGISIVHAAWVGPTAAPPAGNTPAPVNIGTVDQVKNAGLGVFVLSVSGDASVGSEGGSSQLCLNGVCITSWSEAGTGAPAVYEGDLVNSVHTGEDCTNAGGSTTSIGGGDYLCKFSGSEVSCPSGWTQYQNWSGTQPNTCIGQTGSERDGVCPGTSCTTSSHGFSDISAETCLYESYRHHSGGSCLYVIDATGQSRRSTCSANITEIGCY